ncbi:hypothetical protein Moror_7848 [Moniliophthora roreri MCA 2997]|uniref:Uncharacterized protein n=2 Tax=Moniliophthora roreri TaxID=221103 RepID=V2YEK6_MONRO|nr:hypothetical protein Moror_7848 [Moniliophthora roreri MCA 2997]KAI3607387.1 hypothetical protein WG66_004765 [Moniliophthora roreri]
MDIPSIEDFVHQVSDDAGVGDSHNILVYILLFGSTVLITSVLWSLIRSQYPCITIAGLETKEKRVYGLFQDAVEKGTLVGQTRQIIEMKQIELEYRASQIRMRNLGLASSMWFIYLGFHPQLAPTLSTWYNDADTLEQEIQFKVESDTQRRCREELQRRAEV